ncbi:hypothetical protein NitYY0814_C1629 [Nitratiruptor sp. YY08-14]|uniref:GGDEF domain-containing response regulator n=1 Tax=Nitratiruptor sp. YY08-14 TaxID=2724899 RepID=UPI00191531ED|nr:diguanylate cyclase [Nitratiruptor sp. YY08-14]BCD60843.1 hypothetical protein NitYY0810_C1621 [Nitratiruptor sp. YY08-10]BCD64775.1 hypothetical protein NitYY0814_C1629 [Nitratiruptor sp. YY08-14]
MNKILLIEDDRFYAKNIKNVLESQLSYEVTHISSYAEFKQLPSLDEYKFVLLDIYLPDCNECELIDKLIANNKPVIVITASESLEVFDKYTKKRVIDFIIKRDMVRLDYLITKLTILEFMDEHEVLILDDSPSFQKFLQHFFAIYYPYTKVYLADTIKAAKQMIEMHNIKLLIVDYMLKNNETGLEFVRYVRERYFYEDFGIVALTASDDSNVITRFLKSGANDFLKKNFFNAEFVCRIDNVVKSMVQFHKIKELAIKDALTGCYNRYYLFDAGHKLLENFKRQKKPVSIAILDLDHFKQINDTYGHSIGDEVLRHFGTILQNSLRTGDFVVRYGGEEFVIFFGNCSKEEAKKIIEERIRKKVHEDCIVTDDGKNVHYNFSCGICDSETELKELIKKADEKLYLAKRTRGVCVV